MNDCIFCKIVQKEIPAHVVYEDADFLAFMDIRPHVVGEVLVIPKEHYRWVWDVWADRNKKPSIASYFETVQKVVFAQRVAFKTEWILSKVIGEEVPHAHVRVFPSDKTAGDKTDLAGNAAKIKAALQK